MIQATLSQLIQGVFGAGTLVDGFTCIPSVPAAMTVQVTAGNLFQLVVTDASAFGSIAADSTQVMKIAALAATQTLSGFTAPGTAGFSQNYLIEAAFTETDSGSLVLNYYNSANPLVALGGPGGTGVAQNTQRSCNVSLAVKAGTAAATGTQTTPSVDAGYIPLFVVTIANGQATITAPNISTHPSAPFIPIKLPNITGASGQIAQFGTNAINGLAVTGSGNAVLANSPTIATPAISGVTSGANAAAGNIGEIISSSIAVGSAVSLTSATAKTITSITLTAGDWDVFGSIISNPAGTTTTSNLQAGLSTTTNALPTPPSGYALFGGALGAGLAASLTISSIQINVNTTTTVYLVAQATFATSTMTAYGAIRARRVR